MVRDNPHFDMLFSMARMEAHGASREQPMDLLLSRGVLRQNIAGKEADVPVTLVPPRGASTALPSLGVFGVGQGCVGISQLVAGGGDGVRGVAATSQDSPEYISPPRVWGGDDA